MQKHLVKRQLLGDDLQLHEHPMAAQAEDHWVRVLLDAADEFVFQEASRSGVCPKCQLLDRAAQKETERTLSVSRRSGSWALLWCLLYLPFSYLLLVWLQCHAGRVQKERLSFLIILKGEVDLCLHGGDVEDGYILRVARKVLGLVPVHKRGKGCRGDCCLATHRGKHHVPAAGGDAGRPRSNKQAREMHPSQGHGRVLNLALL